jgi:DNA-binding winged helix-turn-helix (wHTH) protein/Flp pilus assembly protein TadD
MSTLNFGPFVMDLDARRVLRGGSDLQLRPRAFQALRVLLLNSGHYVDYEQMLAEGWDGTIVSPHTVGVTVGEVRKALGEYQAWITHRSKVGYRLEVPNSEDLIRRGWHFWNQHTKEGFEEGLTCFKQAAADNTGDFRGFEGMASCYLMMASLGMKAPRDMRAGFQQAHARAVELSGCTTPELRCDHAHGLHVFERRFAEAESGLMHVLREKPGLTSAYSRLAMLRYARGHVDEAMAAVQDGLRLEPLTPVLAALETYIWLARRQFDVAVSCGRRTVALHPHLQLAHSTYGQALEHSNQYDDALTQYRIAATISPDLSCLMAMEGACLARWGRPREALSALQRLDTLRRSSYVDAYYVSILLTALGARDQAFKELDRACDEQSMGLHTLEMDPRMDPLRDDARFDRVRGKVMSAATTH